MDEDERDLNAEEEDNELEKDALTELLTGQSMSDLKEFLASPFWKAIMLILRDQIEANQNDLIEGGIAEKAERALVSGTADGPLYMSDESLRGGLVAMRGFLSIPEALQQELLIAQKLQRLQQEGVTHDDN